jgi:hypothetical protein
VKINKNRNHVCLSGFKISQRIKILIDLKTLLEKPFKTFYYSLKNLFEKIESQNIKLHLCKTYANSFAKEIPIKGFYIK